MKFNTVPLLSAIGIGLLLGWGYSELAQNPDGSLPLGLVVGAESILLWIGLVGIDYEVCPRSGVMVRAACATGFAVLLIINAIYSFCGVNMSFYILNGIVSLILLLTVTGVYNSKQ